MTLQGFNSSINQSIFFICEKGNNMETSLEIMYLAWVKQSLTNFSKDFCEGKQMHVSCRLRVQYMPFCLLKEPALVILFLFLSLFLCFFTSRQTKRHSRQSLPSWASNSGIPIFHDLIISRLVLLVALDHPHLQAHLLFSFPPFFKKIIIQIPTRSILLTCYCYENIILL